MFANALSEPYCEPLVHFLLIYLGAVVVIVLTSIIPAPAIKREVDQPRIGTESVSEIEYGEVENGSLAELGASFADEPHIKEPRPRRTPASRNQLQIEASSQGQERRGVNIPDGRGATHLSN
jgi:hypothetical protein